MEDIKRDRVLRNYVKYFVAMKRDPNAYIKESEEFYGNIKPSDRPIIWLCDESGHHVDKFLTVVEKYDESFKFLEINKRLVLDSPIQPSGNPSLDHIFGDYQSINIENFDDYVAAFDYWKKATRKGILKKIDYILNNPFRAVTKVDGYLNYKYQKFLKINRQKLMEFDNKIKYKWMADFDPYDEEEACW